MVPMANSVAMAHHSPRSNPSSDATEAAVSIPGNDNSKMARSARSTDGPASPEMDSASLPSAAGGAGHRKLMLIAFGVGWLMSDGWRSLLGGCAGTGWGAPPAAPQLLRTLRGRLSTHSRRSLENGTPRFLELAKTAVLMVGGANRTEFAVAAESTWFGAYSQRLYATDTDPEPNTLGSSLASHTVNVFAGSPSVQSQVNRFSHPKSPFFSKLAKGQAHHSLAWELAQHKYLLGLVALVRTYPKADWYGIFDSDSFVYPLRLHRALETIPGGFDPRFDRAAFGARLHHGMRAVGREVLLMGGAGVMLSAAAVAKMNISECVELQRSLLAWNKMASDWRLSACLSKSQIESRHLEFMWMVDSNMTCGEHGPSGCWENYYNRHHNIPTTCPLTLHYMSPEQMRSSWVGVSTNKTVCVPDVHAEEPVGRCSCSGLSTAAVSPRLPHVARKVRV